jgi:hypothetical protein
MVDIIKYNKINEILDYIEEFGITDDSYRDIKVDECTNDEMKKLIAIYMEYGDIIWEYLIDDEVIAKADEFYYVLSGFARACDFARVSIENRYNPKSIHYKPD